MTPIKPFRHQLVSIAHNDKSPIVFDVSDPGTGKTYVRIAGFAKRRKKGGGKMLVLAPRSLLRNVWVNDTRKFASHLKTSVAYALNRDKAFAADADVYITNVDAVKWLGTKKKAFFAQFSEIVVDECFPASTLVDTPSGRRKIADVKVGDMVNTSAGALPVTNTFVSQSNLLVRLELDDGTEIHCTENHPIATSVGWRNAGDCHDLLAVRLDIHQHSQPGSVVLREELLQDSVLEQRFASGAASADPQSVCVNDWKAGMEQGCALPRSDQSKTERSAQSIGAQTQNPGRQWKGDTLRSNGSGDAPIDMATAVCNPYPPTERERVPDLLQGGLRQPETQKNSGSRREFAHIAQTLGCQEGRISSLSRVVRVSRHEQRDPVDVFNLQIDGPHDYSVEGTLVHNCTAYKHHTSARSKAAAKVAKHFKYRCCMTGTPNGNTITDVWHQVYILDEGMRLGNSFYKFRDTVCEPKQVSKHNPNAIHWTDREGAEEAVFGLLADIVVRHKFEDCVDIPANHQYPIEYDLTPKQMQSYLDLETTQILATSKSNITAINAAAVATKLLQVASGAVYDGTGAYHLVDSARYEMILDLVQQRAHSLVFFLWKHQRDELVKEAEKRGVTFAVIDGSTTDRERDEIVMGYQAGVYQTLFAHPKSAAHGLTLTKGTATIWSSPTYDLEIFKQGSKRQHRLGQTLKTETIIVIANGTIEQKVYEAMLAKDARMTNLLDLFGTLMPQARPEIEVPPKTTARSKKAVPA